MEKHLPDTPWHVGFIKKDEDDPRRHKARCIHICEGICNSSRSNYYQEKCGGSSHCIEYSETYEDYQKNLKERRSIEEIQADNITKYKQTLSEKKKQLMASNDTNIHRYKSTDDLRRCLVCDEILEKKMYSLKKCRFCGMFYMNHADQCNPEILNTINSKEVFKMCYSQKTNSNNTHKPYIVYRKSCLHMNPKGRCIHEESKFFKQHCKANRCDFYKASK